MYKYKKFDRWYTHEYCKTHYKRRIKLNNSYRDEYDRWHYIYTYKNILVYDDIRSGIRGKIKKDPSIQKANTRWRI